MVTDIDVGIECIWPHSVGGKVGPDVPTEAGTLVGSLTGDEVNFCSTEGAAVTVNFIVGAAENEFDDGALDLTPDVTKDGGSDPTTTGALLERNADGLLVATELAGGRSTALGLEEGSECVDAEG